MHRLKDDRGCMWMFCSIDGLYQLEKCEKWNDAVSYLYHAWQEQKDRSNLLVRLIGECWYILSLWNCCMPTETMSCDRIKEILYEGIRYGQMHFSEDSHYLCFVGYMLAAPPAWYLFDAHALPNGIAPADEGMRMLRLSVQLEPDNPVSRLLLLGYSDDSEAYNALQQKYRAYIEQLCCDETALTQYFKYILLAPAISTA